MADIHDVIARGKIVGDNITLQMNLGDRLNIYAQNRKIMKELTRGKRLAVINRNEVTSASDYLYLRWITKEQDVIRLGDMKRSHVQNTLNWCIRKGARPDESKDGILYSQWIAYFLARLLDPELE